jgi:hypothetical protein
MASPEQKAENGAPVNKDVHTGAGSAMYAEIQADLLKRATAKVDAATTAKQAEVHLSDPELKAARAIEQALLTGKVQDLASLGSQLLKDPEELNKLSIFVEDSFRNAMGAHGHFNLTFDRDDYNNATPHPHLHLEGERMEAVAGPPTMDIYANKIDAAFHVIDLPKAGESTQVAKPADVANRIAQQLIHDIVD